MRELATFGAGCFWGVEELFRQTSGVVATSVGYMGGEVENPTYRDVCSGKTGHAEVVQIEYDSTLITYTQLLEIFWDNHDPTTLNRQGPDVGTQYRSVIFYHSDQQKFAAQQSREHLKHCERFSRPIVTLICPASTYYIAEDYHQKYLAKRGLSSCGL